MKRFVMKSCLIAVAVCTVVSAQGATMCSGMSASVKLDLATGTRAAAASETIRYSTAWVDGAASGAITIVAVNGETLSSSSGRGYVDWTPLSNGVYVLTHKVMSGGEQIGETLTAMFHSLSTATRTTEVPVPYVWLNAHDPDAGDEYEAYEASAKASAANGRKVWECYVLGLDPEVATNDFRITSFPMKADGTPDFGGMTVEPPPNLWNVPATWKVKGAATLEGPWGDVPVEGNSAYRFFKVEVVLP